jgi:preprotein translocase subunit SecD
MDYLKDKRILAMIILIIAFAILDLKFGLNFGIEFAGGTQIPVTLSHNVTPNEMDQIISILQQRVSTFGLKQVVIEGVGSSQIYVIIPSVSGADINSTIGIIESQGVFQGIVNGKEALNGSSILSGSIGAVPPSVNNNSVSWAVDFFITEQGANRFSKAVLGQANQPLYMFLDRPQNAIVLLNSALLQENNTFNINENSEINAIENGVAFGNQTIPVELLTQSNWKQLYPFFSNNRQKYGKVILQQGTNSSIEEQLKALNYTLIPESTANMTPQFVPPQSGTSALLNSWPAIGLLSAPILSPQITNGSTGLSYQISGFAPSSLALQAAEAYATTQASTISSILSGGALPVSVIVNSPTVTQPTLGSQFLYVSAIAAVISVLAVSMVIVIRYRKIFLIGPILLTTLAELFIVISVIGLLGTIDISAVAGMIAVVGTGVDTQIIMTDEVVSGRRESTAQARFKDAFRIIWINVGLLIIAMLPLLFSTSLVDIIGFAEATILGAILGVLVTRPAYGAIISRHYK